MRMIAKKAVAGWQVFCKGGKVFLKTQAKIDTESMLTRWSLVRPRYAVKVVKGL